MRNKKKSLIKILLILAIALTSLNPIFSTNEETILPEKMTLKWQKLSDQEQYNYFRNAIIEARKLQKEAGNYKEDYEAEKSINDESKNQLNTNTDFLKTDKPFYPKFGFSGGINVTIDKALIPDLNINTAFYFFFFKRFFIAPDLNFKFYKELGGGVGVNIGILF